MTVYRFKTVRVRAQLSGKCPACGKGAVRKRIFEQTISPFNKNPDGTMAAPDEVLRAVRAEADAWVPDFRHDTEKCAGVAP